MTSSDPASVAAALREEGYEARNLGQVGITIWKDGHGLFVSAEDLKRLNGNLAREVDALLAERARSSR